MEYQDESFPLGTRSKHMPRKDLTKHAELGEGLEKHKHGSNEGLPGYPTIPFNPALEVDDEEKYLDPFSYGYMRQCLDGRIQSLGFLFVVEILARFASGEHLKRTETSSQSAQNIRPSNMPPSTMRAVVLKGNFEVAVEDRPYPKIQKPTDAVLKVTSTALCGSDLHFYRGHLKCPPDFICGHEFVGEIVEKGDSVSKFNVGDKVVVPFFTACGECYYCVRGQSSRCSKGELYGNSVPVNTVDGGQAEYVRCPLADSTFVIAPKDIPEEMLVLMADIFPTGYFAAAKYLKGLNERDQNEYTAVVVGCGPVGICAIASALTFVKKVYAIDTIPDRLAAAEKIGAIPINLKDDPVGKIKAATDGRGADVVMEVVGHADALQLGIDLIRPFGQIKAVGVHTEQLNLQGLILYGKNAEFSFGRCPVRSIFEEALAVLVKEQKKVAFLCGKTMSLEDAPQAYKDFEAGKIHKIVFKPGSSKVGEEIKAK